jgi:hypothetical protein
VDSSFKKVTKEWWGLVFLWERMISFIVVLILRQWRSPAHVSHSKAVKRCTCPHWGLWLTYTALPAFVSSTWIHPLVCLNYLCSQAQIIFCVFKRF